MHTLKTKQNKGNKRDVHKPVPEERPKDAAGEEKSANPLIRSALKKPQNIHFKQTSSGCHSTIVSIPSVSVEQEGGEGSGGRLAENPKHLVNVSPFLVHKGLLQRHLVHLVAIHQLSSPCCPWNHGLVSAAAHCHLSLDLQFLKVSNILSLTSYSCVYRSAICPDKQHLNKTYVTLEGLLLTSRNLKPCNSNNLGK